MIVVCNAGVPGEQSCDAWQKYAAKNWADAHEGGSSDAGAYPHSQKFF
jgi:hypothetical protein